jgi:murein L,D-transpeptidase YafK
VSGGAGKPTKGRTKRALHHKVWFGLLLFAAVAAVLGRDILFDWDHLQIEAERSRRFGQAALGVPLAGTPDLGALDRRLAAEGLSLGAPVFIRIFKREFELELWMRREGVFHRFAVYPICRWSGRLGPKLAEGDSQAPEGFYTVDAKALNPASRWHRSFNLGFPNAYDRSHRRTGSLIMVHGGCASIGCFAMTDPVVDEIWRLVTAALKKGQPRFHVHVYPFRLTAENLAQRSHERWLPFWQNLKRGHDLFEQTLLPPRISACEGSYAFAAAAAGSDGGLEIDNLCMDLTNSKS